MNNPVFSSAKTCVASGLTVLLCACQTVPAPSSGSISATESAANVSVPKNQAPAPTEKTFLGIYMVGSDLEDDVKPRNGISDEEDNGKISTRGSGSNDLRELIEGWQALSSAQQGSLNILVAFGGARKQGWRGVKYADMACIQQDGKDNYFGNDSCYQEQDAQANMSEEQTLKSFLDKVKSQSKDDSRVVVDLWDHGAAFLGMGHDTNHDSAELIPLPQLQSAFQKSGLKVDLLGFDACLMASLEVARVVQPFADYLLASQELEPGHGWHYGDFLNALLNTPDIPSLGKTMIDSFITHSSHQKTRNKTLSLTDLKQIPTLLSSLDAFVSQLPANTPVPVLPSLQATPEFGVQSRGGVAYTIDLREFINNITRYQPDLASSGQAVLAQLKQSIVYSREDGSKPGAGGITIFSLSRELKPSYNQDQSVSRTFLGFVEQWLAQQAASTAQPELKNDGFQTAQTTPSGLEVPLPECRNASGEIGQCLQVQPAQGARLERVLALDNPLGVQILSREKLVPVDLQASRYFAPRWDGSWFQVCDGNCQTSPGLFPPAIFSHSTREGHRIYIAEAELNGQTIDLYLELNPTTAQVLNTWAVPHIKSRKGTLIPSRLELNPEPGDSLQFAGYALQRDGSLQRSLGPKLQFRSQPVWRYIPLPASAGQAVYFARASSGSGQQSSYSAPTQAADSNQPLQSAPAAPVTATVQATKIEVAPSQVTLSGAGDSLIPIVYLKDGDGNSLKLPLTWKSLTEGLSVTPEGKITLERGDLGFGQVSVTEPNSGLSALVSINVSRGGNGGAVSLPIPPPPGTFVISSVSPKFGYNTGVTSITISGSNFVPGSSVQIGATPATNVVVVNATTITADVPAGLASNRYNLQVNTPGLVSQSLTRAFGVKNTPFTVNWAQSSTTGMLLNTGDMNSIAFDYSDPNLRYVAGSNFGGNNHLYRSSDGGNTWSHLVTGLPPIANFQYLTVDPTRSGRIYVGENSNTVYRSTDNALNWTHQSSGFPNTFQRSRVVIDPVNPDILYTPLGNYNSTGVLAKSLDGGNNWALLNGDIPTPNTRNAFDLVVDPSNTQTLYLGLTNGIDVMKSTNGGGNWGAANTGLTNAGGTSGTRRLLLNPQQPNTLYALNGGVSAETIYRSVNGGTNWTQLTVGLPAINPGVVYGADIAMDPTYPNILYAAFIGAGVYKSIDGGDNWQAINTGLPNTPFPFVINLAVHPLLEDLVYITVSGAGTDPLYQTVP
jgi:photosystem II stability/assembly factor-like uncharacterized protein